MPTRTKETRPLDEGEAPATAWETAARSCAKCGARLTNAGRKSVDGVYWCAKKRDCVRAKQRHYYAKNRRSEVAEEQAPTKCASCEKPLPARAKRVTDSPYGRWCKKARCRRHMEYVYQRNASGGMSPEDTAAITTFIAVAANPENVVICPECGLGNAVKGYRHPWMNDGKLAKCFGVGEESVHVDIIKSRWPERFPA